MSTFAASEGGGFGWLRWLIELSVLLAAAVAVAALALLMPDLREWLTYTLGFGWAVVGLFLVATLLALAHWPAGLFRGWRWWLAGALVVGMLIVGAAFVRGDAGTFYTYGMAGEWGYALTGGRVGIAVLELSAALVLIGLLLIPNGARWYALALRYAGVGIWRALAAAASGIAHRRSLAIRGHRHRRTRRGSPDRQPQAERLNSQAENGQETQAS